MEEYCEDAGEIIHFHLQPAQSPDLNVLDGSFFRSLCQRAHVIKRGGAGVEEIRDRTLQAFMDYDKETLARCFGHLYAIYNLVLGMDGNNQYDEPHADVRNKKKEASLCTLYP